MTARSAAGVAVLAAVLLCAATGVLAGADRPPASPQANVPESAAPDVSRATRRHFGGMTSFTTYVTMRDGVRLAANVYVPKGLQPGERTATILHMSRYFRAISVRWFARPFYGSDFAPTERDLREPFVKAGYSWVDVDVRGTGASFGSQPYFLSPDEVRDGADLMDWIDRQSWAAGPIGTLGSSYDGALALMLARNRHPALRAIAARFCAWDGYGDEFVPNGLQATVLLHDWSRLLAAFDRGEHGDLGSVLGWETAASAGLEPVDPALLPAARAAHADNVDIVKLLSPIEFRDDAAPGGTLRMADVSPHLVGAAAAAVPVYAEGGWFDGALARGLIRQFLAYGNPGSRLLLGPWFHGGEYNASPFPGGARQIDHAKTLLPFFDYHLRGIDAGFSREPRVEYYAMGAEAWQSAPTWPPPGGTTSHLYLGANHALTPDPPAGPLASSDTYQVDPNATTDNGSRWVLVSVAGVDHGYKDQRERDRTLLTYTGAPLPARLEVTGHPIAHVFLSANATDGALFAYLQDVRPNGQVWYVTEGGLRLIDRKLGSSPIAGDPVPFHSFRRPDTEPLVPGEPVGVVFDLQPTSFVFQPGDRIRLALAGADKGMFAVPWPAAGALVYDIYRDAAHASVLDLPILAGASARTWPSGGE